MANMTIVLYELMVALMMCLVFSKAVLRKISFNDVYGVCVRVPRGRLSALELGESRVYEFQALGSRLLEPTAFTLGIAVSTHPRSVEASAGTRLRGDFGVCKYRGRTFLWWCGGWCFVG